MLYLLYFGMPFLVSLVLTYALCCKFRHTALRLIPVYIGTAMAGVALLYLLTDAFPWIGVYGWEGVVLLAAAVCVLLGSGAGRLIYERA